MSKYLKKKSKMCDKAQLIKALEAKMPKWKGHILSFDTPQPLYGYQGDDRTQSSTKGYQAPKCDVIIPGSGSQRAASGNPAGNVVGGSSNDLGFYLDDDGTYTLFFSDYDQGQGFNEEWLDEVKVEYSKESYGTNMGLVGAEPITEGWMPGAGRGHNACSRRAQKRASAWEGWSTSRKSWPGFGSPA